MLVLAELGTLDNFHVFNGTGSLPAALDALPFMKTQINIIDRLVKRDTLPRRISEAAGRLVIRSRRAAKFGRLRGHLRRALSK